MGYEVNRFLDYVDEEYLCSICLSVFENPVHGPCGHTFCSGCIDNWIGSTINVNSCPLDKKTLYKKDLTSVSIPFRNLLTRLRLKCDFEPSGCVFVCQMNSLPDHVKMCPFNPNGEMICETGCDLTFLRKDKDQHQCIPALKEVVAKLRLENADLRSKAAVKRPYEAMTHTMRNNLLVQTLSGERERERRDLEERDMDRALRENALRRRLLRDTIRARTPDGTGSDSVPSRHQSALSRLMGTGSTGVARYRAAAHDAVDSSSSSSSLSPSIRLRDLNSLEVRVQRLSDDELASFGYTSARDHNYGVTRFNPERISRISLGPYSRSIQSGNNSNGNDVEVISSSVGVNTSSNGALPSSNGHNGPSSSGSTQNGSSGVGTSSSQSGSRYDLLSAMLSSRVSTSSSPNGSSCGSASSSRD